MQKQLGLERMASGTLWAFMGILILADMAGASDAGIDQDKAFLDHQSLYEGWYATYGHINSLTFKCCHEVLDKPEGRDNYRFSYWERIQDGDRYVVSESAWNDGPYDPGKALTICFDGKVAKEYDPRRKFGAVQRGQVGRSMESADPIGQFLLNRVAAWTSYRHADFNEPFWAGLREEFPAGMPLLTSEYRQGLKAGWVRVRPDLEQAGGEVCHVLEIGPDEVGNAFRTWLAHEKGMLPMRIEWVRPRRCNRYNVLAVDSVMTEVGQVWFPRKGRSESQAPHEYWQFELRVDEYIPHVRLSAGAFDLRFPDGASVLDAVAGIEYKQGRAVAQAADAVLDGITKPEPNPTGTQGSTSPSRTIPEPRVSDGRLAALGEGVAPGPAPGNRMGARTGGLSTWLVVLGLMAGGAAVVVLVISRSRHRR